MSSPVAVVAYAKSTMMFWPNSVKLPLRRDTAYTALSCSPGCHMPTFRKGASWRFWPELDVHIPRSQTRCSLC